MLQCDLTPKPTNHAQFRTLSVMKQAGLPWNRTKASSFHVALAAERLVSAIGQKP